MSLSSQHADWLNANALRRYPLVDGSTAGIPNALIVDILVPVSDLQVSPEQVFLRSVTGFVQGVVITLGLTTDPSAVLASATIFLADHELNKSYVLVGSAQTNGSLGRISIGTSLALQQAAANSWDFQATPQNALLVPSTVRPAIRGITSFSVPGLGTVSGNVTLRAGSNITMAVNSMTGEITINSGLTVTQEQADEDCGCAPTDEPQRPCIRAINGVLPDSSGNIQFVGLGNLVVTTGPASIILDDSSSEPCCECDQLDVLYQALQAVENESSGLRGVSEQLRLRLDTMSTIMNNAQLNPPSFEPTP